LVPVALAFSLGIFLAESGDLPLWLSLLSAAVFSAMALAGWFGQSGRVIGCGLVLVSLGYAWRAGADRVDPDGMALIATETPAPVRVQGVVVEGPWLMDSWQPLTGASPPRQGGQRAECMLLVRALWLANRWEPASGRLRVIRDGDADSLFPGRCVELLGLLRAIPGPMNPGEADPRKLALRLGIQAELNLAGTPAADDQAGEIKVLREWSWRPECWLAAIRFWGADRLRRSVRPDVAELAVALVLGETRGVDRSDWLLFQRTGVIHVLAISGQHLVMVAWALYLLGRMVGFRTRQMVLAVAVLVFLYALVTGGRPPALRAAVTILAMAAAWLSHRPASMLNCLALSWLVVAVLMPADLSSTGCLLSFFATGLLQWATRAWWQSPTEEEEAYQRAVDLSRPPWLRWVLRVSGAFAEVWRVNLVVWLGLAPLVAARTHLVSLVAILVGPPVSMLGGWALGCGFLLVLVGPDIPVVSALLGELVTWSLRACRALSQWGESLPGAWFHTPGPSSVWLGLFHVLLLAGLLGLFPRLKSRWLAAMALLLLALQWVPGPEGIRSISPGWRCAFLAVGHGSCVVVELSDPSLGRRVMVVDAGSVSGEGIIRRVVEPFLRHRGINRIDDLILTHADLDHFAGALELVDRIGVDRVWTGPGFSDKENDFTRVLLEGLAKRRRLPGTLHAGMALAHGDCAVSILHPPADLPEVSAEKSNEASLVLRIDSPWGSALLPGDLEGQGTKRLLASDPQPAEVLLAPHHGSRKALAPALLATLGPRLVVAQQGPRDASLPAGPFTAWSTRVKGAVEVECGPSGGRASNFATSETFAWPE
jgi:competence protein ComEC